jgi:hypothetical protein
MAPLPPIFSDVWQAKELGEVDFVCVAGKGVRATGKVVRSGGEERRNRADMTKYMITQELLFVNQLFKPFVFRQIELDREEAGSGYRRRRVHFEKQALEGPP